MYVCMYVCMYVYSFKTVDKSQLGIAIPEHFSNPGISGLKNANPGIPGLNPGIESLILN